ncbi:hypothetical protein [Sphingomonas sp. PB4P5]|uniref:hypothetical protein n=1 Tax=Parasphingomonas puruogangriensis TaxID=3096155 RepID=UPI002FC92A6A
MKIIALATLLALAACSSEPPAASNETQAEVAPSGDVGIVAPAGPTDIATASPAPAPTPTPSATPIKAAVAARAFPVAFRGRWGMNANDCDPKRDDNKGLITVSADAIKFYESRATIAKLSVSSPTRIAADLSFSGEGQTWQSRTVFDLSDGGKTLARAEEEPSVSYVYAKCA